MPGLAGKLLTVNRLLLRTGEVPLVEVPLSELGLQLWAEGMGITRVGHQEDLYLGRGDVVDGKDRPVGQPILQITEETTRFETGIATQFGSQIGEVHVVSGRGTDLVGEHPTREGVSESRRICSSPPPTESHRSGKN